MIDKSFYVYILKCRDGSYYTGWTVNIANRFKAHSEGKGAKYTRGRLPVVVVYSQEFDNKSDAMKREVEIKKLTRQEKEILVSNYYRKE